MQVLGSWDNLSSKWTMETLRSTLDSRATIISWHVFHVTKHPINLWLSSGWASSGHLEHWKPQQKDHQSHFERKNPRWAHQKPSSGLCGGISSYFFIFVLFCLFIYLFFFSKHLPKPLEKGHGYLEIMFSEFSEVNLPSPHIKCSTIAL